MLLHTAPHTYFHQKLILVDLQRIYREVWLVNYEFFYREYKVVIKGHVSRSVLWCSGQRMIFQYRLDAKF